MSKELALLRNEIDEIDAKIIDLLEARFRVTAKVGKLKALHAIAAVDPGREAAQEASFRELAEQRGLNPELVVRIFRGIIDEVVENHRKA